MKFKQIPSEPSDEVILALLRITWPATYKKSLRSPYNGPKSAEQTERDIQHAIRQYKAIFEALEGEDQ